MTGNYLDHLYNKNMLSLKRLVCCLWIRKLALISLYAFLNIREKGIYVITIMLYVSYGLGNCHNTLISYFYNDFCF